MRMTIVVLLLGLAGCAPRERQRPSSESPVGLSERQVSTRIGDLFRRGASGELPAIEKAKTRCASVRPLRLDATEASTGIARMCAENAKALGRPTVTAVTAEEGEASRWWIECGTGDACKRQARWLCDLEAIEMGHSELAAEVAGIRPHWWPKVVDVCKRSADQGTLFLDGEVKNDLVCEVGDKRPNPYDRRIGMLIACPEV